MAPVPENRALSADPAPANDYDGFAEAYSAENETCLNNAYYERPATLALADAPPSYDQEKNEVVSGGGIVDPSKDEGASSQ
jgi:hypothetical protein